MKKEKVYEILLYGWFVIMMIMAISDKKNLYVDEVYSYGLANSNTGSIYMPVEDGTIYYPAGAPWIEYMAVERENRFDYANVWKNQAMDVHPPLYYAILHSICSVFPGSFSIWFAGLINIVFAMGTLFFLRKIVRLLTQNELLQCLVSIAFVCSAGILSAATFLRMYIMAMFWVTTLTYLVLKKIGEKSTFKTYLLFLGVTIGGAMTHYYCIVYIVFISVVYVCYLALKKDWRNVGFFSMTQGTSVVISISIFPAMLGHILTSGRGEESAHNFVESSFTLGWNRLKMFFEIVDTQLFGGFFIYLFFGALVLMLLCNRWEEFRDLRDEQKLVISRYICVLVPVVLYFVLISKIAVFITDRYMYPIYAVLLTIVLCGSCMWLQKVAKQQAVYLWVFLIVVLTVNGWKNVAWEYQYRTSQTLLEAAAVYSDVDCIYIYDKPWELNSSYYEVSAYHSVTFLAKDKLDLLGTLDVSDDYCLIVTITSEDEKVLEEVMNICPALDTYDYVGGYAYTNTYYLYGM